MAKKAKKPNSGNIRGQNTQPAMAENGQKDKGHGRKWPKRQRQWPKLAKKGKAVAENGQPWPKKPEKPEKPRKHGRRLAIGLVHLPFAFSSQGKQVDRTGTRIGS